MATLVSMVIITIIIRPIIIMLRQQ